MGAIASGGVRDINEQVLQEIAIPRSVVEDVVAAEEREMARREREYRGDQPPLDVRNRIVILVDDGLATGASMHAVA